MPDFRTRVHVHASARARVDLRGCWQVQEQGARAETLATAVLDQVTGVIEALVSHVAAHKLELRRAQEAKEAEEARGATDRDRHRGEMLHELRLLQAHLQRQYRAMERVHTTAASAPAASALSILLPQQVGEGGAGEGRNALGLDSGLHDHEPVCRCVLELTLDMEFSELRDNETKQLELQHTLVLDLARALQAEVSARLLQRMLCCTVCPFAHHV